jgi:phosphoglycolate phosphatase-like HAD superfamily hydrolase
MSVDLHVIKTDQKLKTPQPSLHDYKKEHELFIGIDSDGCVFDSMDIKQKEFFIPLALRHFDLWPIAGILRKTWEFINLYSIHRGGNRFLSLMKVFDLLSHNSIVISSGVSLPDLSSLKQWTKIENKLGNDNLRKYFEAHPDKDLGKVLLWSEEVNREINRWFRKVPLFPPVKDALQLAVGKTDLAVVSQTPYDAIEREWRENNIAYYVKAIAGQEHGTKKEQLEFFSGYYEKENMLMVGDALGDMNAALSNGIKFFPIVPGKENESWLRFIGEGFEKFKTGKFDKKYQDSLLAEFRSALPERMDH